MNKADDFTTAIEPLADRSNQFEYDDTITKLLTGENFNFNDEGVGLPEFDFGQNKAFTLDNILNEPDLSINGKRPLNLQEGKQEEPPRKVVAYDDTILSPISLSPLSTDDNSRQSITESKKSKINNDFTMNQIKETKKRIINTHKLMLNFNLLKDSYNKTCEEFKKSIHNLKESEIQRAHLYQENEKLRKIVAELNEKSTHQ